MNYQDLLVQLEGLVRAAKLAQAGQVIQKLNSAQVPRELRLPFANLCRRIDHVGVGLRLLEPVVFPEKLSGMPPPSAAETAEYGVLLLRAGAADEAAQILSRVDPSKAPESLLYRGFLHMGRSEDNMAAEVLGSYVKLQTDPYKRLIGQVNLAYALLECGRIQETIHHAEDCYQAAKVQGHMRLTANSLELKARCHLVEGSLTEASECLDHAALLLNQSQTRDQLWVQKWLAVIESIKTGSVESLARFRIRAEAQRHWLSVREADLYMLKVQFSRDLFDQVYAGTPLPGYRQYLLRELGHPEVSDYFAWGDAGAPMFDIRSGRLADGQGAVMKKGSLKLLEFLMRDFYQPLSVGAIFSGLFPGDHFCIFSSPQRVHQNIYRLRCWLKENQLPIEVKESHGRFRIERTAPFRIFLEVSRAAPSEDRLKLLQLREVFGSGRYFRPREACSALNLASSSFNRFTRWAIDHAHMERTGVGKATRYRITA